jgi:transposase
MARNRIEVKLTPDEHERLSTYVARGQKSAREINRARILLLANDGLKDQDLAKVLGMSRATIYNMRKKYHHKGDQPILDVLQEEPRGGRPMKFDSTVAAKVTMIACSAPPQGAARWTLHLIADKLVKLDIVDTISHESVRSLLKKTSCNPGSWNNGASGKLRGVPWGIWKMCCTSMPCRMIRCDRCSALMNGRVSSVERLAPSCL